MASQPWVGGLMLCPVGGTSAVVPGGQQIADDGTFVLPHIVDDTYDVIVSIPMGNGMSRAMPALSAIKLPPTSEPLP